MHGASSPLPLYIFLVVVKLPWARTLAGKGTFFLNNEPDWCRVCKYAFMTGDTSVFPHPIRVFVVSKVKVQEQLNSAQNNYKGIMKQYVISLWFEKKLFWTGPLPLRAVYRKRCLGCRKEWANPLRTAYGWRPKVPFAFSCAETWRNYCICLNVDC
jgi:hypothetical protein